jgi:hypothetical protein
LLAEEKTALREIMGGVESIDPYGLFMALLY